jgi:hypothetical protein
VKFKPINIFLSRKLKSIALALILIFSIKVNAQVEEPFSKINLEINCLKNKSSEFLNRYWESKLGLQGTISFPFYFGKLQAGVNYYSFTGRENKYPAFKGFFINAGFGKNITLPLKLLLSTSVKVGSFLMYFNADTLSAFQRFESELAVGLNTVLKIPITNYFYINIGGEFVTVFLHYKIKFLTAYAGLEYSFSSPAWLKEFLK